jgi:hypothetical protein
MAKAPKPPPKNANAPETPARSPATARSLRRYHSAAVRLPAITLNEEDARALRAGMRDAGESEMSAFVRQLIRERGNVRRRKGSA